MTPQELAAQLSTYSPQDLRKMDHRLLYAARDYVPRGQQNQISPYEHRAFAREVTMDNPLMALPVAASIIPYQAYKALNGARSTPSLDQVTEGFAGIGDGLWGAFQQAMQPRSGRTEDTGKPTSTTGLLESLRNYLPGSGKASTNRQ